MSYTQHVKVKIDWLLFCVCLQVSGQENSPRGQRLLTAPIWSQSLGINYQCQYSKPSAECSSSSPTGTLTQLN